MEKTPFTKYAEEARARGDTETAERLVTEGRIAGKLVDQALEQGYRVSVYDGEETVVSKSDSKAKIIGAMASTDEDTLTLWTPMGQRCASILLVYGNGTDLISDYSANDLDAVAAWLKPVTDYAESLES